MGAAIWSTRPKLMLDMPASFFIRFFKNHGLLQVTNRPQWWVIKNGSKQYVKEIIKPYENNIKLNAKVKDIEITRNRGKAPYVTLNGRAKIRADQMELIELNLSLSHSKDFAVASIVGKSNKGNLI